MIGVENAAAMEEELRRRRTPQQWRALRWLGVVFVATSSATPIALTLMLRERLPSDVATRVALSGEPTTSMSQQENMVGLSLMTLFCVSLLALTFSPRLARMSTSSKVPPLGLLGAFTGGLGGFMVGVTTGLLTGNLDIATWQDAQIGARMWLFIAIGATVGALAGWWVDRSLSDPDYRRRAVEKKR